MSRKKGSDAGTTSHYSDTIDISTHMSSQHIWNMFVHLLFITLQPLAHSTSMVDDIIHVCLAASMDKRRKVGAHKSEETVDYLYKLLYTDPDTKLNGLLKVLGIERTVISAFIEDYLNNYYEPSRSGTMSQWEDICLSEYTKDMYQQYCDFKNMVTNRFLKLSNSQAAKNQWIKSQQGLVSDVSDHENNFYLSVIRAVDKFYPNKGTLASYVMLWLNNAAGSSYSMYLGEAFTLTRSVRLRIHKGELAVNNKSYDIESAVTIPLEETPDIAEDTKEYLALIAKVQTNPQCSLAMFLGGYDLIVTPEMHSKILQLQSEGRLTVPNNWKPTEYDLEDLPVIAKAKRSPRTNKEVNND